jgi:hypothetical protein
MNAALLNYHRLNLAAAHGRGMCVGQIRRLQVLHVMPAELHGACNYAARPICCLLPASHSSLTHAYVHVHEYCKNLRILYLERSDICRRGPPVGGRRSNLCQYSWYILLATFSPGPVSPHFAFRTEFRRSDECPSCDTNMFGTSQSDCTFNNVRLQRKTLGVVL